MKSLNVVLLGGLAVTGCAADEAPLDIPPPSVNVTVRTSAQPELVAYREDASTEWNSLDVADTQTFSLSVAGPYRLVVVCRIADDVIGATQYARTIDDDLLIDACQPTGGEFAVQGHVTEPGRADLGASTATGDHAPWDFELPADKGTYDLALLFGPADAPDRIALQRDLEVEGDVTLPEIDAASVHATALVPATFTAANLVAGETLTQQTRLRTPTLAFDVRASAEAAGATTWKTALVPASLLQATDHQSVALTATSAVAGTPGRTASRTLARELVESDAAAVTLPAALGAVALTVSDGKLAAALAGLPAQAEVVVWQQRDAAGATDGVRHETRLSPRFRAATNPTSAVVDFSDVPDFDAAWQLGTAGHQGLDAIQRTSVDAYASAGVRDDLR